jgi:hypothetical protein
VFSRVLSSRLVAYDQFLRWLFVADHGCYPWKRLALGVAGETPPRQPPVGDATIVHRYVNERSIIRTICFRTSSSVAV